MHLLREMMQSLRASPVFALAASGVVVLVLVLLVVGMRLTGTSVGGPGGHAPPVGGHAPTVGGH